MKQTFAIGLIILCTAFTTYGDDLHNWKSSSGTEIRAAFKAIDPAARTVTLLIPRTISFDQLSAESVALAQRLEAAGKRVKSVAADEERSTNRASATPKPKPVPDNRKWYEDGTLLKKNGLEWQKATKRDKLASCADIVAALWNDGKLNARMMASINSIDDMRPYAQQLADNLDAAFKPELDPDQNRKLYINQDVATFAAILITTLGWVE